MAIVDAVVPVAGRGSRLAPLTRAVPKGLLPLGDRPVVDHVLDELAQAGTRRAVLVTSPGDDAVRRHLAGAGGPVTADVVEQPVPRGLGDAVRCAAPLVSGPFVLALGDALLRPATVVPALVRAFEQDADAVAVVAVVPVGAEAVSRYGIVAVEGAGAVRRVTGIVEKPAPADAPSDLAVAARYVLGPEVMAELADTPADAGGEVQLTDALAALVAAGAKVLAVALPDGARRLDAGSIDGYCATFLEIALTDARTGPALRRRARELLS